MKKLAILCISLVLFTTCKEDTKTKVETKDAEAEDGRTAKQSDGLTLLKGDFIYYADAAVLQTHKEVYGVILDEKAKELNEKAQQYKSDATDMVTVAIRGEISEKIEGEEGWQYRVAIKEILTISKIDPEKNDIIKIGS